MSLYQRPVRMSPRQRRLRYLGRRAAWAAGLAVLAALAVLADRAGLFGRAKKSDWETYHGQQFRVVHVVDGDTLDVDCPAGPSGRTRVRLLGVDTPESVKPDTPVQHFGPQADRYLRGKALGKTVMLELDRRRTRDAYHRLLAYVIGPDGENLNESIVSTGHGYADPRYDHPLMRQFQRAQKEALKAGRGLWQEATNEDLPYYYRDKLKLPLGTGPARP